MSERTKRWVRWIATALVLGIATFLVWQRYGVKRDDGLTSGNGRIEATEIDVAAKIPGRIKEVLAHEGDFVTAGQVVARMDTDTLEAQLHEAQAILYRGAGLDTAWPQFLALAAIGTAMFVPSLARFRRTIGTMA